MKLETNSSLRHLAEHPPEWSARAAAERAKRHSGGSAPSDFQPTPRDDEAALREELIGLSEYEFEKALSDLKERFGVGVTPLRKLRTQALRALEGRGPGSLAGQSLADLLAAVDPSDEPVDVRAWFDEAEHVINRYVALPEGGAKILAAWCLSTWFTARFGFAAYLAVTSPAPGCGKSTLLRLAGLLVYRPLPTAGLTPATLFRIADEHGPTWLLDEQDGAFERSPDLLAACNAGFQRGQPFLRCVGDDHEPRAFDTFGPKLIISIAPLPPSIVSRSFTLRLERSTQPLEKLDPLDRPEALVRLQRQAARIAEDHEGER